MRSELAARLRGLYAVTPGLADTHTLCARVEQALAGGAALVQYRAKGTDATLALEQARRIRDLCRACGALLIVNDSVDLARACDADGVHVGREDAGVAKVRSALPRAIIGASCYDDPALAARAAREGADYVAIGSVFASGTKPGARRASLATIADAARICGLPVAAIGGINADNALQARNAGADMLAVISAVFDAPDVAAAARAIAQLYGPPIRIPDVRTQPSAV
jgi:thiamine-phosphate pyrophosphorylase